MATSKVKEMTNSVKPNINREKFWNDINNANVIEKYFPITIKTKIDSGIRKILSKTNMYTIAKSITKKILRR